MLLLVIWYLQLLSILFVHIHVTETRALYSMFKEFFWSTSKSILNKYDHKLWPAISTTSIFGGYRPTEYNDWRLSYTRIQTLMPFVFLYTESIHVSNSTIQLSLCLCIICFVSSGLLLFWVFFIRVLYTIIMIIVDRSTL